MSLFNYMGCLTVMYDRDYVLSYAILFGRLSTRRLLFDFIVLSNEDKDKISDICITVQEKLKLLRDEGTVLNYDCYQDAVIYLIQKSLKDLKHNDNEYYCKYIMVNSILYATVLGYVDMYKLSMFRRCLEEVFAEGCYSLKQLAINGNDLIEFDLSYFNTLSTIEQQRDAALEAYPKVIVKAYKKYVKEGNLKSSWFIIPSDIGVCLPLFDGRPFFLTVIPAIMAYDEAVKNRQEKEAEDIRKIIV